jgi:hypothetical protein
MSQDKLIWQHMHRPVAGALQGALQLVGGNMSTSDYYANLVSTPLHDS